MPIDTNAVGDRGENLAFIDLTRTFGATLPFFRPQFLGGKFPTIDFFVELIGTNGHPTPYFLVQVKATSAGYMTRGNLRVRVKRNDMAALVCYPAPTYIIGVDEVAEVSFLKAAVNSNATGLPSMPVTFPLAERDTLQMLYEEVLAFWQDCSPVFTASRFL